MRVASLAPTTAPIFMSDGTPSAGKGMDAVGRVAVVPGDQQNNGRPVYPVVIRDVKIEQR